MEDSLQTCRDDGPSASLTVGHPTGPQGRHACLAAVTQTRASEDTSCSPQGTLSQISSLSRQVSLNPSVFNSRKCPHPGRQGHFTNSNGNFPPSQLVASHRLLWVLEATRQVSGTEQVCGCKVHQGACCWGPR